ncbi:MULTISPECIES: PA0069 family radical SAM protein [unclassified Wenzhouxiangella]|uniref:PA0069 family radical SAM protein n=1 Tax=unclassified Wenzhouxiangella TaxID=2613841 RepID=UPI000E32C38E|nr:MULTISPECIES: PA0069 family radical SAM protein [unclassified Wenzhouxiangella]RFF28480.1 PA0069 family radical SAM protein [Wenzhouxiangella sp. 15181]RFP69998.1 PA0069 family radical SAM protein [Wenzhouxiangella sp. 15190]
MRYHRKTKGRGAATNPKSRFSMHRVESLDDGWTRELEELPALRTTVRAERARSIISRNGSPDVPFEQSINPYRGCEHGCVYCFARPSHSYLDLSPGLDFETRLFHKENAVELLEAELRKPGYHCRPIVLGINTDAYQPIERELRLTRRLLELLVEYRHPVSILTKGVTILRDLDVLSDLARDNLVSVSVSITTLDNDLKRTLEPRTASPNARLRILSELRDIDIHPGVMFAPVIPAINDREIEAILKASADAGATRAGYVVLRLPHELKDLFREWLGAHYPERADHVMSLVRQLHGGHDYDPTWGRRQTGAGQVAELIANRFRVARRRHGLDRDDRPPLNTELFRAPTRSGDQMGLWTE